MRSQYERHNFGQQRHRIEAKLKLRSLYKGIENGQVKSIDTFDFKNAFRQMADDKLNNSTDDVRVDKKDLLKSVHQTLKDQV